MECTLCLLLSQGVIFGHPRRDPYPLSCTEGFENIFTVFLGSGRLYTFGNNNWGQLGHGNTKPYTKPSVVKSE